ncbi:MAG TPA: potassium transporter TrkG [Sulfuriferula sp.]|nr:potassium transporter TrkG [Sulfuriferula sp.]
MLRVFPILNVIGLVVLLFAFTMLTPLAVSFYYQDAALHAYDEAILITFAAGLLLWLSTRHLRRELKIRDGYLLVVLVWTVLPAFATLPLLFYMPHLSFTDAYFETMSGLSTTGATVLSGLDQLPKSINLWRHLLNWLGGMGIIVLAVAILPLLGVGGRQLYKAETPGPMKDSKLTPRIAQTAKALWLAYSGITVACIVSLRLAGMSWFDAVCHAFATMGLGGFSTHDASIGYFNSPAIEAVLIVFMLLAAMNFATHFLALSGRSLRVYLNDPEVLPLLGVILIACLSLALYLWHAGTYASYWTALRFVSFNLVSIATDCGFANTDFNLWPMFVPLVMLLLSCVTVSSGSTGGGIKMIRTLLMLKQGKRELEKQIHNAALLPVKIRQTVISNQIVFAVQALVMLYVTSIVALTLILVASGLDFVSSFSAVIACINNAGPGLNKVGPATTYAILTDFQTWVCSFAMLLGRLEIFTLLVLFTPAYWRK